MCILVQTVLSKIGRTFYTALSLLVSWHIGYTNYKLHTVYTQAWIYIIILKFHVCVHMSVTQGQWKQFDLDLHHTISLATEH